MRPEEDIPDELIETIIQAVGCPLPFMGHQETRDTYRRILAAVSAAVERCPSCDHLVSDHQPEGCWYTVSAGTVGRNLVCPCSLPSAEEKPENRDG